MALLLFSRSGSGDERCAGLDCLGGRGPEPDSVARPHDGRQRLVAVRHRQRDDRGASSVSPCACHVVWTRGVGRPGVVANPFPATRAIRAAGQGAAAHCGHQLRAQDGPTLPCGGVRGRFGGEPGVFGDGRTRGRFGGRQSHHMDRGGLVPSARRRLRVGRGVDSPQTVAAGGAGGFLRLKRHKEVTEAFRIEVIARSFWPPELNYDLTLTRLEHLRKSGDFAGTEAFLDESIRWAPDNVALLGWKGLALTRAGRHEAAVAQFKSVLDNDDLGLSIRVTFLAERIKALLRLGERQAAWVLCGEYQDEPGLLFEKLYLL